MAWLLLLVLDVVTHFEHWCPSNSCYDMNSNGCGNGRSLVSGLGTTHIARFATC